ncbi:MAG: hypothetical protein ACRD0K_28110 [Egibacteraceae bacterium]
MVIDEAERLDARLAWIQRFTSATRAAADASPRLDSERLLVTRHLDAKMVGYFASGASPQPDEAWTGGTAARGVDRGFVLDTRRIRRLSSTDPARRDPRRAQPDPPDLTHAQQISPLQGI